MLEDAVAGQGAGRHVEAGRAALAAGEWEAARDSFERSVAAEAAVGGRLEGLGVASVGSASSGRDPRPGARVPSATAGPATALGAARVARQVASASCHFHADVAVARAGWSAPTVCWPVSSRAFEHGWQTSYRAHLALQVDRDTVAARATYAEAPAPSPGAGRSTSRSWPWPRRGVAMVSDGEVDEGHARLDEAAAAAMGGEVDDPDAVSSAAAISSTPASGT